MFVLFTLSKCGIVTFCSLGRISRSLGFWLLKAVSHHIALALGWKRLLKLQAPLNLPRTEKKKERVCLWYILGITAIHGTDDDGYTDAEDDDNSNQYRVMWPGCGTKHTGSTFGDGSASDIAQHGGKTETSRNLPQACATFQWHKHWTHLQTNAMQICSFYYITRHFIVP